MEIRAMFWTIAGLIFVGVLLIVALSLSGSLLNLQTCSSDDTYDAYSNDKLGMSCGDNYCNYIMVTGGTRGLYRDRDACVDKDNELCCRNCYEAVGSYKGMTCGYELDNANNKHYYRCLDTIYTVKSGYGIDNCTNEETHRCCRMIESMDAQALWNYAYGKFDYEIQDLKDKFNKVPGISLQ
jgi:hypothetical protein